VVGADRGEPGVLGHEAVARVDRVAAGDERRRDDVRDVEVRTRDRARTDAERFVRLTHVQRFAIGFTSW